MNKVWYEWHAEAFLPTQHNATASGSPNPASILLPPTPNGTRGFTSPTAPSPMMDAHSSSGYGYGLPGDDSGDISIGDGGGRLKIGQTSLHNPSGRGFSMLG